MEKSFRENYCTKSFHLSFPKGGGPSPCRIPQDANILNRQ